MASDTKDLRQASLLIIPDINTIPRKHQLMAALFGKVILSAAILDGGNGVKLSYSAGSQLGVFVYVTDGFRNQEPGLTMILREACAHGWKAVTMNDLQARSPGPKNSCLLLRAKGEALNLGKSRIQCLDGNELVAWAAQKFVDVKSSAWISTGTACGGL